MAERLEDRYTLVIPDQRGHGRTPLAPEPFTGAEDTIAVLDELGIERTPVVGNSFGGRIALQLATLAPERVAALVLLASALPGGDEPSPELKAFFDEENALWEAGDVDGVVDLNVRTWVKEPANTGLFADMVRTACELQRGAERAEVPDAGHMIALERPDATAALAVEFLERVGAQQRVQAPEARADVVADVVDDDRHPHQRGT